MHYLIGYVNKQFDENDYKIEEVKLLYAVAAYDGLECSEIIDADCLLEHWEAGTLVYYGICPKIVGEEIDINEPLTGDHEFYCPVAFILDPTGIKIKEAYPFDPFELGDVKISTERSKFCLGNDVLTIRKYIRVFFGSNENYIKKRGVKVVEKESVIAHILSQMLGANILNRKKCTVSLFVEEIHPLECIKCIILPEKLLAYDCFRNLETKADITIKTYETEPYIHPMFYNLAVDNKIREFYSENGLL